MKGSRLPKGFKTRRAAKRNVGGNLTRGEKARTPTKCSSDDLPSGRWTVVESVTSEEGDHSEGKRGDTFEKRVAILFTRRGGGPQKKTS